MPLVKDDFKIALVILEKEEMKEKMTIKVPSNFFVVTDKGDPWVIKRENLSTYLETTKAKNKGTKN